METIIEDKTKEKGSNAYDIAIEENYKQRRGGDKWKEEDGGGRG